MSISEALECCALVSIHEEMNPSKRRSMEDALRVVDAFGGNPRHGFFGLFDGHGGREISAYLQENLHIAVENELTHLDNDKDGSVDVETCIKCAFVVADMDCCELPEAENAGSTAAIALLRDEGNHRILYAANVGDSRIVLCRNGTAERVTQDHKAELHSEAVRVCDSGGFVIHNRVSGVLAVSRSFGDSSLKKWVIAQPYTSKSILDGSCAFFILACDGVWDELEDQAAVDLVLALSEPDRAQAAEVLVGAALEEGSCDNISAIVVFL
ncbi:hypothetical protein H310_05181 [Aphanomyces invadans]|uniref:PPM-type phosphatase domain-containing protein n=1 Tax=Aphanomyces invadans TaxID=157072 RepID=A0A024UBP4_9STRA|nr:hypothetical protein H310_05181 [Aphanomyces invadans]ETW03816.1 hypothetical protein H310_05181 [Aphanomyces invadans]|eukprot:XP_008868045.1 hypothetical protein H310_05181 [Aphanomyces invadans]